MGRLRRARASCCALALALPCSLAFALPARAQSPPHIPSECGSRAGFDAELKKRLGDDAPVESVQVALEQRPSGFHLRVQIGTEVRELDDEDCAELLRAAVVVAVAMLLHEHEPPQSPSQQEPPPPAPAVSSHQRPLFALAAGAGVCAGTLPPPVLGLELEAKALWRRFGVGLALRYLSRGERRDDQGRGVRLQALGVGAVGIFRPSSAWEARLGFAAQHLFGEGFGENVPTFTSRPGSAWAAGPTLGLGFTLFEESPFWVGLGAEGQLNVVRGNFQIRNYSENIYDVPWLAGSAFVRFGLSF